jgi:hypothetical protein
MRDILGDLRERADLIERQIRDEQAQFGKLIARLTTEQNGRLAELKAQLESVNGLIRIADWQWNVRAAIKLAIAVTEAVEVSAAAAARCSRGETHAPEAA